MGKVEKTLDEFIEGMKAGTLSSVQRAAKLKEFVRRLYLELKRAGLNDGQIVDVATQLLSVLTENLQKLTEATKERK